MAKSPPAPDSGRGVEGAMVRRFPADNLGRRRGQAAGERAPKKRRSRFGSCCRLRRIRAHVGSIAECRLVAR